MRDLATTTKGGYLVTSRHALVVEDDHDTAALLSLTLARAGLDVSVVHDGDAAVDVVRRQQPDLVTLDLGLPGMDGLEACRRLRAISTCYIVVLSGRDSEVDKLLCLEAGADDYLVKPFSPRELRARVGAMFRRPREGVFDTTRIDAGGGLEVDVARREVTVDGDEVSLTRTEFEILAQLVHHTGQVVAREDIVASVWRSDYVGDSHMVDVHMGNLRRKLRQHADHQWIRTVRGIGYRLDPVTASVA